MNKIVNKVWGHEEWIINNDKYCYKKLTLKKHFRCSLHMHKIKDETFVLEEGKVLLEAGDVTTVLTPGDLYRIKPGVYHRFTGLARSVIKEISTHHEDEDSYRLVESGPVLFQNIKY